jgi:hypothetical protein
MFTFGTGATAGRALFDAIPFRQSTRADFDGKAVSASDLQTLAAAAEVPGVDLESQSMIEEYPRIAARLPAAVYDLALRLGANPRLGSTSVRLGQSGRMRQIGDRRWMAFRAKQDISTLHCAFDWRARAAPPA